MKRSMYLATLAAIGLTAATLAPTSATAQQQVATTGGVTSTIEVVATGLNAPRGLVYDKSKRRVLLAEAGIGAVNLAAGNPCGFAERGLPFCLGQSGSIYQFNESSGSGSRIVTGLPSTTLTLDGSTTIGLHDIDLRDGVMTVSFGTLGNKQYRESLGPGAAMLGHTASVSSTGQVQPYGDILTFEDNLHAPLHIESNPYGVLGFSWGAIQVNAGGPNTNKGNDLLLVLKNGQIFQLAQFPERPSNTDPTRNIRAVPTSVAIGPDGALYVGELSGAPFFPGEARVWRVVPGQAPTVYQQGFSTIIDIRFDSRGRLIVLQTSADPFDTAGDGALIRVEKNGTRTTLASTGLTNPGGVALVNDNTFYITRKLASADGTGSLVKVRVSE